MMHGGYGDHMGMGWMGFWWILGAVLIALLVAWVLFRARRGPRTGPRE